MESSQKAYPRSIIKQGNSLLVNIPAPLATRLNLTAGQFVLVGESNELIIIKSMDSKLSKKDLKTDTSKFVHPKVKSIHKKEYDDPFDDPDFDPLAKLEIK